MIREDGLLRLRQAVYALEEQLALTTKEAQAAVEVTMEGYRGLEGIVNSIKELADQIKHVQRIESERIGSESRESTPG